MRSHPSLRGRREFARVYRSGRRARRDGVTVYAVDRDGRTRVGLAVRSAAGSAVVRNRIRRRLRAAAAAAVPPEGLDVAVEGDGSVATQDFQELTGALAAAVRAVGGTR
jgi:ribonuclease P protein component